MKNKFISNRVIKLNDGTIFFTSDKNRPTRDEIYFIDFWRENLSMYRMKKNADDKMRMIRCGWKNADGKIPMTKWG